MDGILRWRNQEVSAILGTLIDGLLREHIREDIERYERQGRQFNVILRWAPRVGLVKDPTLIVGDK